jgi:hypothetical protein
MRFRDNAMALREITKTQAKKSPRKIGGLNPYQWRHGGDNPTVPKPLVQRNISLSFHVDMYRLYNTMAAPSKE